MEYIIVGLIVLGAAYYTYNHLKKEVSGEGSNCDCSSCPMSKKDSCSSTDKKEES